MNGFIKIHRQILEWDWYRDIKTKSLFLHLLLRANFKENSWQGVPILPGQVITGRKSLAQETDLSEKEIRTSLSKLEKTGELAIKATNKFSVITICKWDRYQLSENEKGQQTGQQGASKGPAKGQQRATTEEEKEGENERKNIIVEKFKKDVFSFSHDYPDQTLNDFFDYWTEQSRSGKFRFEAERFFDISRRLATWHRNSTKFNKLNSKQKFIPHDSVFINT